MNARKLILVTVYAAVFAALGVVAIEATAQDADQEQAERDAAATAPLDFRVKLVAILRPEERARLPEGDRSLPPIDARGGFYFAGQAVRIAAEALTRNENLRDEGESLQQLAPIRDRRTALAAQARLRGIVSPRDSATGQASGTVRGHALAATRGALTLVGLAIAHEESWSRSRRARDRVVTEMMGVIDSALRAGARRPIVIGVAIESVETATMNYSKIEIDYRPVKAPEPTR